MKKLINSINIWVLFVYIAVAIGVEWICVYFFNIDKVEILHNLTGFIGFIIATPTAYIAYMRQKVLETQNKIGLENKKIAEQAQLNTRYSKSVELLSAEKSISKIGGINSLAYLGDDWDNLLQQEGNTEPDKKLYKNQRDACMDMLCDCLRDPVFLDKESDKENLIRNKIVSHIVERFKFQKLEKKTKKNWGNYKLDLSYADLRDAIMGGVNLQDANLPYADLQSAMLLNTSLQGAHLQDANLRNANLQDANLRNANLLRAVLQGAHLRRADLQNAFLQDADLRNASLQGTHLQNSDLQNSDLQDAFLQDADLRNASLRNANLQDAVLWNTNLHDADLQCAKLQCADLWGAFLCNIDMSYIDINDNTRFKDSYYSDYTKFPKDFKPQDHKMIKIILNPKTKQWERENGKEDERLKRFNLNLIDKTKYSFKLLANHFYFLRKN